MTGKRASRLAFLAAAAGFQLFAALILVALWFHVRQPRPNGQMISPREWQSVSTLDGVPVWKNLFDDGMRAR